ncbi:MAG: tRNA 2-thiocytidine(32) synthetase TtcA [Dokdonella sp.]
MTVAMAGDAEPNADKLARQVRHQVGQAIADYRMIGDGDRIMVCLSGGKDSWVMLDILRELQARAPIRFELLAVHLDQKQPGYDATLLPTALRNRGIPFHIIEQDTYSVVERIIPAGRTMCSLCSRLRRGALYEFAAKNGYNRIALGHHRDDIVETLFLNLFYQARLKAMPPKLRADDGRNIVIRPLAYCAEVDLAELARHRAYPIIPCDLCGSQETLQRKAVKRMLQAWETETPGRIENIFRGLTRIEPSQLADPVLFDFGALGVSPPDGYPEQPAVPVDG